MKAYVYDREARRGELTDHPDPSPGPGEVLLAVEACGLCRTDLHILDGELRPRPPRVVLGHQVVGRVIGTGAGAEIWMDRRVGVPWLAETCGSCRYCRSGRENLCEQARFTGLDRDGGLAERMTAVAAFVLPLADELPALTVAPLLCAGAIGWRALQAAGHAGSVGIYGFGAAAHLVAQILRWQGRRLFAFTRPGDHERQAYARTLGAVWTGGSDEAPPELLDAAILFAAAGELVPRALAAVAPGGTVVCGEIHMTDIPAFPYALLWREKVIRSIANLTRRDSRELLELAARIPLRADAVAYPFERAEQAIADLRAGRLHGAAVVTFGGAQGAPRVAKG